MPRTGRRLSARCGRTASRLSRRLDLGAALQQRHHQRRRGADRSARGGARAPRRARRPGTACSTRCHRSRAVPRARARRCRSSTRRAWRFGATGRRREVGAAAVCRRRDRSAALDGFPADAARPGRGCSTFSRRRRLGPSGRRRSPTTRESRRRSWTSPSSSWPRSTRRMADPGALQAPEPAVLRRGQLQRDRAPARPAAPGSWIPAACASRDSARRCAPARGSPRRRRPAPRERRSSIASIAPSSRSMPPACSIARAATGIRCSPSDLVAAAPKLEPQLRRSIACSSGAD